ncbi:MAG: hypothetical protein IPK82_25610 [Polyangiaceae bacterium]|nr:hypothetical protein [Polyangiaceae bacterium]
MKEAGAGRVTPDVRATPWSAVPITPVHGAVGETTLGPAGKPPALFSATEGPPVPPPMLTPSPEVYPSPLSTLPASLSITASPRVETISPSPPPNVTEAVLFSPSADIEWTPPPPIKRVPNPSATKLSPADLAQRLKNAGAGPDEINAFLLAIDPPPPPDDPDE